jgi:taurine dioxygenase
VRLPPTVDAVPPSGGDTQWAAMGPTFEALSAGLQATLLGLGAIHANVRKLGWAPGSIAMWDNRQTRHFAVNDYRGQRRVMHRILLAGSKPVPAS